MKFNPLFALAAAAALGFTACEKSPEQKAADATSEKLDDKAKDVKDAGDKAATEVKNDAAVNADVLKDKADAVKKDGAAEADAIKKNAEDAAKTLEKKADEVKDAPK